MSRSCGARSAPARGYEVWRGPSAVDGAEIVVIATTKTRNTKTGDMVQVWILRTDGPPAEALADGRDRSICGDCPFRPRSGHTQAGQCYVNVCQAPTAIWRAWKRGRYPRARRPKDVARGQAVRFGAYGDPTAAPYRLFRAMAEVARTWTGYTHRWANVRRCWSGLLMASTESAKARSAAQARGWRTFNVRDPGEALDASEIGCPAAKENGARTQCARCALCKGRNFGRWVHAKSVSIVNHSPLAMRRAE